ncbi:MAG: 16S rRNA (guanine(527)-N(7))-methyltransferase RsmG [Treponema sp.]|jgi:16S rRNA (guanine527-N7)-methyltransferase|nr:16S rRNA (guanine(527)-N(7))-methyltransferase RsmG [Treponema sp.]
MYERTINLQEYGNHEHTPALLEAGIGCLRRSDPDIERFLGDRTGTLVALLERYIHEIERFNPVYHLVKVRNRQELVVKHILDSLGPLGIILRFTESLRDGRVPALPWRFADVGSGAGLPGIPLAISLRDSEQYGFTLIERMGRRAGFLRNTQAILGLPHVTIEEGEMEKSPSGRFHLIMFRAFRPLEPMLLTSLFRLLVPGGALFAYKGRQEAITVEMHRVEASIGSWERIPLRIPFLEEERHLVVLRPPLQETKSW